MTITPGPADTLTYTGPTAITNGSATLLSATLVDSNTLAGLPGRTLTLTLGPAAGNQSCTAVTNGSGYASCFIYGVSQPDGTRTMRVTFNGDAGAPNYPYNQINPTVTISG